MGGLFVKAPYARLSAGFTRQYLLDRLLRGAGRPLDFAVLDAPALTPGDRHQGALHRRWLGNVQLQQLLKILFDAPVVGAQGEQNLPQFLPSLLGGAGAQPFLRVGAGRNQNGADDVAEFLAGGGAHGAADGLHHVYRTLAGLQESHRAQ